MLDEHGHAGRLLAAGFELVGADRLRTRSLTGASRALAVELPLEFHLPVGELLLVFRSGRKQGSELGVDFLQTRKKRSLCCFHSFFQGSVLLVRESGDERVLGGGLLNNELRFVGFIPLLALGRDFGLHLPHA